MAGNITQINKEINFRELGGYVSDDGRTVRHGMLFRSGALARLNEEELEIVRGLGLRLILDFRAEKEAKYEPDPVFDNCEHYRICAAFDSVGEDVDYSPAKLVGMLVDEDQKGNAIATVMASYTAAFLFTNKAYEFMFEKLLEGKGPTLFHCTGGKDRTGVAAILILLALGVSKEQATADYLLTNEYRKSKIEARLKDHSILSRISGNVETAIRAVEGVIPESSIMVMTEIEERFGTLDNFFLQEYGMDRKDIARLRDLYLE